jgi:hypothetical protein
VTSRGARPAGVEDLHQLAVRMPHVTVGPGSEHKPVYQVGGKSFVFFRNPRPDAFDPDTGERYGDVIVFWVPNEGDKLAMVQEDSSIGEITYDELAEVVQDAWLSRTSAARRSGWLKEHLPD